MVRTSTMPASFARMGAALTVLVGIAAAAPASAEWRGAAVIRTHTAACATGGTYTTGAVVNARYRLPNLLGNGPETRMTFYDRFYGFAVKKLGTFSSSFLPATGSGFGSGGAFTWTRPITVRVVSRVPAIVTATTSFVNMKVQITNFDDVLGCTVTIDMSLMGRQ